MIFLIEYNRKEGNVVTYREFDNEQLREAEDLRLEMELDRNRRGINHDVILMEAESRKALKLTHGRYFEVGFLFGFEAGRAAEWTLLGVPLISAFGMEDWGVSPDDFRAASAADRRILQ